MSKINKYEYMGAIHIHTNKSDGSGDLNSVVKAAKKAGLNWIIVTDHNYIDSVEGIYDGIYVIKGEEISPITCNHYLALGIKEKIEPEDNPQIYVNKVRQQGGFGFSAHPDEGICIDKDGNIYPRKNSYNCIPWIDKSVKPDGVEIWNWFSNWADNLDDSSILSLAYTYIFKHNIIKNPSVRTLDWWDSLNNETDEIVPAIGGVDAHALKYYRYIIPVTVFPYTMCFKTITNVIYLSQKLPEDFIPAKQMILNAIKNGQNIIINRHLCKDIPNIYLTKQNTKYVCGEKTDLDEDCKLHIEAKNAVQFCLIYNGNVIERGISTDFTYHIKNSGKYRIELFNKGKGYLYTNPFNIKDKIEV